MSERIPIPMTSVCALLAGLVLTTSSGCGTARVSDTPRTVAEELLVTHSIDEAVGCLNFSVLQGHRVFLDTQYLTEVAYKGYLTSALRQRLVATGCRIAADKESADVVLEARAGSVATMRNDSLVGFPQTILPTVVPGVPSAIPEIALMKKTVQTGVVQISVFAYRVDTGAGIWQSGAKQRRTRLENRWYFGAGPYQSGDCIVTGPNPRQPPLHMSHDKDESEKSDAPGPMLWETMLGELPPVPDPDGPPPVPEVPEDSPPSNSEPEPPAEDVKEKITFGLQPSLPGR